MIANDAEKGHGRAEALGGRGGEVHVLEPERGREARRLEAFLGEDISLGLVDRRGEKRGGQHVEKRLLFHAALGRQSHRLGQSFDRGHDHEVSAELNQVRGRRRVADPDGALTCYICGWWQILQVLRICVSTVDTPEPKNKKEDFIYMAFS